MNIPKRAEPYRQFIEDSAERHGLDPCLLAAIISHESNYGASLTPPGPAGTGDHTHGCGLGQIDDRAHPELISQVDENGVPRWQDPAWNIEQAARILAEPMLRFADYPDPEACCVAAYNAGAAHVRRVLIQLTRPIARQALIDALDQICTAGTNGGEPVYYVTDCLYRRSIIALPKPGVAS